MRKKLISIICISVLSVSVVLSGCQSKSSSKNNSEVSNQTSTLDDESDNEPNVTMFSKDGLVINGGIVHVNASGDGIDSNGTITINGGEIYVDGPTSGGDGALDYADTCEINGGILVAAGSIGMATAPTSGSTQYSVNATFSTTYNGGTKVTVKDSSGNEVLTYTPAKNFQSFVFSTDKLKSGETYTIYAGDTQEGTFTVSDITTTVGNVSSGMGGGKPDYR